MRRILQVSFVVFSVSVFALSGEAQRRGRGRRNTAAAAVAVSTTPPNSARIAEELGTVAWGSTPEQVVDYYRRQVVAEYLPLLRNKGQVEQDRLMQERDAIVANLRRSFLRFNGLVPQRRWDTSFVGSEYTHTNNESMLVYESPRTGDREFYFFFNDRLWKRFQARNVPRGSPLTFDTFVQSLDGLFGGQGLRRMRQDQPDRVEAVLWQDATTQLRVIDHSTFYGAYCLVYEDKAVLSRLAQLRTNAPAKVANATPTTLAGESVVGNVTADTNEDVVDRITGRLRRTQTNTAAGTPAAGANANGAATVTRPATPTTAPAPNNGDPLNGLNGL
ncbi:MAG: hypothetical protein Q8Q09_28725 [Deltaproteobacteria bacterium]|nr:hypothetical protein [Deltaproteobacteria bacterium]